MLYKSKRAYPVPCTRLCLSFFFFFCSFLHLLFIFFFPSTSPYAVFSVGFAAGSPMAADSALGLPCDRLALPSGFQ